jgi:hypothetical protein
MENTLASIVAAAAPLIYATMVKQSPRNPA